ncbi:hypothetical protein [Paramagnetospirillum caucaseum]|uniref:hypothetical protein n=1 Tax=Paramagnetospirillum caucaseum TaxID=1244869 RepID=UPI0012685D65|nr:hypothetical protein [Paramagnetospirillum caucaseum]
MRYKVVTRRWYLYHEEYVEIISASSEEEAESLSNPVFYSDHDDDDDGDDVEVLPLRFDLPEDLFH